MGGIAGTALPGVVGAMAAAATTGATAGAAAGNAAPPAEGMATGPDSYATLSPSPEAARIFTQTVGRKTNGRKNDPARVAELLEAANYFDYGTIVEAIAALGALAPTPKIIARLLKLATLRHPSEYFESSEINSIKRVALRALKDLGTPAQRVIVRATALNGVLNLERYKTKEGLNTNLCEEVAKVRKAGPAFVAEVRPRLEKVLKDMQNTDPNMQHPPRRAYATEFDIVGVRYGPGIFREVIKALEALLAEVPQAIPRRQSKPKTP